MQVFLTIASWLLRRCIATLMTSVHSRHPFMLMATKLTLKSISSIFSPARNVLNGCTSLVTIWNGNLLMHSRVGCNKLSSLYLGDCLKSSGQLSTRKLWRWLAITFCVPRGKWWNSSSKSWLVIISSLTYKIDDKVITNMQETIKKS